MISPKLFVTVIIVTAHIINKAQVCQSSPVSGYSQHDYQEDSPVQKRENRILFLRDLSQIQKLLSRFKQVLIVCICGLYL